MKKQDRNEKFAKVMREYKAGTLKSSSGMKVKSRAQAMAIAASESGLKPKRKTKAKPKK